MRIEIAKGERNGKELQRDTTRHLFSSFKRREGKERQLNEIRKEFFLAFFLKNAN